MASRALRQFYGTDRQLVLDGLPDPVAVFRGHRERFLDALADLSEDEWSTTTRCDAWNVKDICNHLVTADGFWALTLQGRGATEPTTYLRGFDPSTTPGQIIAPMSEQSPKEVLAAITDSTATVADALGAVGDDWDAVSESPLGHLAIRAIAAHALWDSWLHERDVFIPLGRTPEVADGELLTATAFTLFLGGTQGGVLDDPDAVGEGPDGAVEASLSFSDLSDVVIDVRVDRDVRVVARRAAASADVGSAVDFVEGITGRAEADAVLARLPAELAAQLDRARQIL